MRGREQTFLTDLIGPEDQAIEAVVGRYQRVAPAVTRLARSLSDNPNLRVRLGPESSASPDEIICDPRIFQAAYHRNAPVNALGYLRVMFTVEDLDDVLARLGKRGAELVGEVVRYEDAYRLCYIRGPEGILIGLAQEL